MKKPSKRALKRFFLYSFLLFVFLISFPFIWRFIIQQYYGQKIHTADTVPAAQVAVVFGAGLGRDGGLSAVLRDRMDVAISLYEAGTVQKLLVSGDNRFVEYDEPGAMRAYAIAQGVDDDDIQPDYGGRRTYDTCYRAKNIFQIDEAILVTQEFHLPRALLNCRQLGIDAVGVSSDLRSYWGNRWFSFREIPATMQSSWDVIWKNEPPVMGGVVPMFD